eukprot:Filipodium_phascolosomae@DN5193_c0_g1_i1.p1
MTTPDATKMKTPDTEEIGRLKTPMATSHFQVVPLGSPTPDKPNTGYRAQAPAKLISPTYHSPQANQMMLTPATATRSSPLPKGHGGQLSAKGHVFNEFITPLSQVSRAHIELSIPRSGEPDVRDLICQVINRRWTASGYSDVTAYPLVLGVYANVVSDSNEQISSKLRLIGIKSSFEDPRSKSFFALNPYYWLLPIVGEQWMKPEHRVAMLRILVDAASLILSKQLLKDHDCIKNACNKTKQLILSNKLSLRTPSLQFCLAAFTHPEFTRSFIELGETCLQSIAEDSRNVNISAIASGQPQM